MVFFSFLAMPAPDAGTVEFKRILLTDVQKSQSQVKPEICQAQSVRFLNSFTP